MKNGTMPTAPCGCPRIAASSSPRDSSIAPGGALGKAQRAAHVREVVEREGNHDVRLAASVLALQAHGLLGRRQRRGPLAGFGKQRRLRVQRLRKLDPPRARPRCRFLALELHGLPDRRKSVPLAPQTTQADRLLLQGPGQVSGSDRVTVFCTAHPTPTMPTPISPGYCLPATRLCRNHSSTR
jgi:hypothetical protein